MSNNKTLQPVDLTYLTWSLSRSSIGTAGSFLKSYEEINGRKFYYKMSNYDSVRGVVGHESVNEIVAQNIADALQIIYEMVKERITWTGRISESSCGSFI